MKNCILSTLLISFAIMVNAQSQQNFKWLIGSWKNENPRPDTMSKEIWSKQSDGSLIGLGITMKGKDTVFVERLRIIVKNDKFYFVAEVSQNKEPTFFEITQQDDAGFTAENPAHDFPKKIVYRKEGDLLIATTSGDGKEIPFLFRKM